MKLMKVDEGGGLMDDVGDAGGCEVVDRRGRQLRVFPLFDSEVVRARAVDLSENEIAEIPPGVRAMRAVRLLRLRRNRLTGALGPRELAGLGRTLTHLDVSGNAGLTDLPGAVLGRLVRLQVLDVSATSLAVLPDEIASLVDLRALRASQTMLTTLPPGVAGLTALEELDVRAARLVALPGEIGSLVRLRQAKLDQNMLTGLPESIGHLRELTHLWLDRNRLVTLPRSFSELRNLEAVFLGGNALTVLPARIKAVRARLLLHDLARNPLDLTTTGRTGLASLTQAAARTVMLQLDRRPVPAEVGWTRREVAERLPEQLRELLDEMEPCDVCAQRTCVPRSHTAPMLVRTTEKFLTSSSRDHGADTVLLPLEYVVCSQACRRAAASHHLRTVQ